jgi:TonB family protein
MSVVTRALGFMLLCTAACDALDQLDRTIESKVEQLNAGPRPTPVASQSPPIEEPMPVAFEPPTVPEPRVELGPSKITIGTASVHGSLSAKKASRIIERHINELRFCHEQSRTSIAPAKVVIKFVVAPTGAVQASGIESSDSGDERLDVCLISAVRRWTFPAPEGGGIVVITLPLELSRGAPLGR